MLYSFFQRSADIATRLPYTLVATVARIGIVGVFLRAGLLKLDGFSIAPGTFALFEHVYKVPFLPYVWAAYMGTFVELVFPSLLLIGLFSRFSALILLFQTLVIETVFPHAWPTHSMWAAALLCILRGGPGVLSLDHVFGSLCTKSRGHEAP